VPKPFPKKFWRDVIAVVRQGDKSIAQVARSIDSNTGSKNRTGQPMASRDHARGVWVNVSQRLGSATDREGIDTSQAAAGGLLRWIRTTSTWVGVVNVIMVLPDGSTTKYAEQLIPARALRPR
jgi:hypothetical protein